VPFLGFLIDFDRPGAPSLVLPYCENRDLKSYISRNPNVDKLPLVSQMTEAIDGLADHSR
jgi:hypothetical protein